MARATCAASPPSRLSNAGSGRRARRRSFCHPLNQLEQVGDGQLREVHGAWGWSHWFWLSGLLTKGEALRQRALVTWVQMTIDPADEHTAIRVPHPLGNSHEVEAFHHAHADEVMAHVIAQRGRVAEGERRDY